MIRSTLNQASLDNLSHKIPCIVWKLRKKITGLKNVLSPRINHSGAKKVTLLGYQESNAQRAAAVQHTKKGDRHYFPLDVLGWFSANSYAFRLRFERFVAQYVGRLGFQPQRAKMKIA
jgi:hypothetical protein